MSTIDVDDDTTQYSIYIVSQLQIHLEHGRRIAPSSLYFLQLLLFFSSFSLCVVSVDKIIEALVNLI